MFKLIIEKVIAIFKEYFGKTEIGEVYYHSVNDALMIISDEGMKISADWLWEPMTFFDDCRPAFEALGWTKIGTL